MAININAKTTGVGGLETSADNSGNINIQSGGTTVMSVTSSGVAVTGSFSQNGAVYSTQPSFRNLIINGDMRIDQRNAGASVTYNGVEAVYNIDRFQAGAIGGGSFTVEQSTTAPSGFDYSQKYTVGTADTSLAASDRYSMYHYIEGNNVAHLDFGLSTAKTVTVSFWVRSSITGTFGVYLSNAAFNRSIPSTFTINAANTWEQKTVTFTGDTTGTWLKTNQTGLVLGVSFAMGSTYQGTADTWAATAYFTTSSQTNWMATSGATFYITGVQLEVGSTATDFENLPYDVQLARCQRYYSELKASNAYTGFGAGVCRSATTVSYMVDYPKTMRTAPTIAISGTIVMVAGSASGNISGIGATYPGFNSALLQSTGLSGSADGRGLCVHAQNDTSAKFTFSAEL